MFVAKHHSNHSLAQHIRGAKSCILKRRLKAILLARQGQSGVEIARELKCSARSVRDWVTRYNEGGLEQLLPRASGRQRRIEPGVLNKARPVVTEWLRRSQDQQTIESLRQLISTRAGIECPRWMARRILAELGVRMGSGVPARLRPPQHSR